MRILVTGAAGFIGSHTVAAAVKAGHDVVAVVRSLPAHPTGQARYLVGDLHGQWPVGMLDGIDAVLHLAWHGLPNYNEQFHLQQNLPNDVAMVERMVDAGISHLLVAGTCYEYGLREGVVREDDQAKPLNCYAQAKDKLRIKLQSMLPADACLQWARLFYVYGPGQHAGSLLPLLEAAVARGDKEFAMSPGDQQRDFIEAGQVAKMLVALLENPQLRGIVNVCSGRPTSVLDLVRQRLSQLEADIELKTGAYPYPANEGHSYWGDASKIGSILTA